MGLRKFLIFTKEKKVKTKLERTFKSKDIDLITYLRFIGLKPFDDPLEEENGTRWAIFPKSSELDAAVMDFLSGNKESELLNELRRARSFLLDKNPRR